MKRQILMGSNPALRTKSSPVTKEELATEAMQQIIDDLFDSMETEDGVGLAAPQVGITKQVIIVTIDGQARCLINPVITPKSKERVLGEEGCLSFPGVFGQVARYRSIAVSALDRNGKKIQMDLADFNARVVQHEADHLEGILLPDRLAEKVEPGLASQVVNQTL